MKPIFFVAFLLLFSSCAKHHIVKTITKGDIQICWYLEDHTDHRWAYVTFTKNNLTDVVLCTNDISVTNVLLNKDSIIIHVNQLKSLEDNFYQRKLSVDKYLVVLKESGYEEWFKHFHPHEKYWPIKGEQ